MKTATSPIDSLRRTHVIKHEANEGDKMKFCRSVGQPFIDPL